MTIWYRLYRDSKNYNTLMHGVGLVAKLCPTLATPWAVAFQAPLFMGFSRQEYWSGLLFPPPGHLPNPGIEPTSPPLQVGSSPPVPAGKPLWGPSSGSSRSSLLDKAALPGGSVLITTQFSQQSDPDPTWWGHPPWKHLGAGDESENETKPASESWG